MNVPQELTKDETSSNDVPVTPTPGGFGVIEPVVQPVELDMTVDVQQENQPDQFVSADELKENRLSQNGMSLSSSSPKGIRIGHETFSS